MIHSAKPTQFRHAVFSLEVALFLRDFKKYGRTHRPSRAKIVITSSRDCHSASWINKYFYKCRRNEMNRYVMIQTFEQGCVVGNKFPTKFIFTKICPPSPYFRYVLAVCTTLK